MSVMERVACAAAELSRQREGTTHHHYCAVFNNSTNRAVGVVSAVYACEKPVMTLQTGLALLARHRRILCSPESVSPPHRFWESLLVRLLTGLFVCVLLVLSPMAFWQELVLPCCLLFWK
jgi:hypothetical protein